LQQFRVGDVSLAVSGTEHHSGLRDFVADFESLEATGKTDLELIADDSGLRLLWNRRVGLSYTDEPLAYFIDVAKFAKQMRSYPAPKQGAFNQALGKKSRHIIDATGGWGGDALLMCAQGYQVTLLERQPIMAVMLSDAMSRLSGTVWARDNDVVVPTVVKVDSIHALRNVASKADCIYLDPMFPPKKKKSAAVNKNMQLLQWLVGEDRDSTALLGAAIVGGAARIVVKRPDHAEPLKAKPSVRFSSKLVHYDVYLRN